MLERHKRLLEVRKQQVEVRLEQAAIIQKQIELQINCMATADEAVVQLTTAKTRFPALRRLTLGGSRGLRAGWGGLISGFGCCPAWAAGAAGHSPLPSERCCGLAAG